MTTISCVLKSGGEYNTRHVERLRNQLMGNTPPGTPIACITDEWFNLPGIETQVVPDLRPKWWSKTRSLRIPGPNLQLDLDVTITGDLTPLLEAAKEHEIIVCRCFFNGWKNTNHVMNSSVMAWSGDVSWIADEFDQRAEWVMRNYTAKPMLGDQAFIRDTLKHHGLEPVYWQDILPGMVLSHKCDLPAGVDTSNMRICVHHGKPRPWEVE